MCVCDSAPSVNTNIESFYILYSIPFSFVYRLSSSGKREKKEGSDALENNKQSLQPCPGKKNRRRNDEKTNKQINKQKKKRNVIVWELVEKAESFWRNFDPHVFTF